MTRRATLRDVRTDDGADAVWATIDDHGNLRISGQNLSRRADFYEYEWAFTVSAERVPALVEALGGDAGEDVLARLTAWYEGPTEPRLQSTLKERGIEYDFWSRVGD